MHKLDVLNISEAHKDEKKYSLSRFHQFFSNMMVSETQDRIAKKNGCLLSTNILESDTH